MFKKVSIFFVFCFVFFVSNNAFGQVQIISPDSNELIDLEEDEEADEESIEFDSIIVETNGPYWDFLRPRDFTFDTIFKLSTERKSITGNEVAEKIR